MAGPFLFCPGMSPVGSCEDHDRPMVETTMAGSIARGRRQPNEQRPRRPKAPRPNVTTTRADLKVRTNAGSAYRGPPPRPVPGAAGI
jgi:hypothetical protein